MISWKLVLPMSGYTLGLSRPIPPVLPATARAWLMSAQKPAHVGALQLVPPTTEAVPL